MEVGKMLNMKVNNIIYFFFFFQAEDGIRDLAVTGVQTCALPISSGQRDHGHQLPALVGGNLALEQGRQLVTVVALAGGLFFASDDLRQLAPERRALLTNPEVLSLAGGPPALPDWEPDETGHPATHWRRDDLLAVFHWTSVGPEGRVR